MRDGLDHAGGTGCARALTLGLVVCAAACGEAPDLGATELASTVAEHETSTCSTAVVLELSRQIAAEVDCMGPGQLVPFAEGGGVVFAGSAVLPYVSSAARAALLAAVAAAPGRSLEITSAYRTVAQQYLLYRWYQLGRCGITAAATPGGSNHESGRAIDVGNYVAWTETLPQHGWRQTVPGDEVHFDHQASPDLRGTDVQAFQRLWNRNHPDDPIGEDGQYGPMTEQRLRVAPAEGFAEGPACAAGGLAVAIDRIAAPRALAPGAVATVELVLRNTGSAPWPAGTALVTSEPAGRASELGEPGWPAPDRPAVLDAAVAPGAVAVVTFAIAAPAGATPGERTEAFALDAGGTRFGAIALVVVVDDHPGEVSGGCDAAGREPGDATTLVLVLGVASLAGRRRRQTLPAVAR